MNAYDLPASLTIGGVEHPIRTGWRAVMDIFAAFNDPDFDNEMKTAAMIQILYPKWRDIPEECMMEAVEKACEFIDCGQIPNEKHGPQIIDWEQDAALIIPAVNQVAKMEVRQNPDIHWWTFFGWYMTIEDSLFSSVINIRQKKASGKKLEKWEKEFYSENKRMIDLKKKRSREEQEEVDNLLKWL